MPIVGPSSGVPWPDCNAGLSGAAGLRHWRAIGAGASVENAGALRLGHRPGAAPAMLPTCGPGDLGAVSDARQWRLTDAPWPPVQQVLAAVTAAVETDDLGVRPPP